MPLTVLPLVTSNATRVCVAALYRLHWERSNSLSDVTLILNFSPLYIVSIELTFTLSPAKGEGYAFATPLRCGLLRNKLNYETKKVVFTCYTHCAISRNAWQLSATHPPARLPLGRSSPFHAILQNWCGCERSLLRWMSGGCEVVAP